MPSNITTSNSVDPPVVQDANYRFDATARQYIDDQIRGLEQQMVNLLLGGVNGTWFTVDGSSSAIAIGDAVCSSSLGTSTVTRGTSGALTNAGAVSGIALTAAGAGGQIRVAIDGILPPTVTGLASVAGFVRATSGRCERVASIGPTDYQIGYVDTTGYLTLGMAPKGVGSLFTAGGDLTGTPSSQQVVQLSGTLGVVTIPAGGTLQWGVGPSGGNIKIATQTSDTATTALSLGGQYAFATATLTNRKAGNVIVDIGIPTNGLTGTASEANFGITRNGSRVANIGLANDAAWNGLWLGGDPNGAASHNNAAIVSDGSTFTYVIGPSAGAAAFGINGSVQLYVTQAAVRIFGNGVTGIGGGNAVMALATAVTQPTSAPTGTSVEWVSAKGRHVALPSTQFVDWMIAPLFTGTANTQQNKFWEYGQNLRTTDATTTTILTLPLATSSTNGCIQVVVTGRDQAAGTVVDGISFSQMVQFKNVAGTVSAAGTQATQLKAFDASMAACTLTYTQSGTNVLVQVTGLVGVTIDWAAIAFHIIN